MKFLPIALVLALLLPAAASAQWRTTRVYRGPGTPASNMCNTGADLGIVYTNYRNNGATYVCRVLNGQYKWVKVVGDDGTEQVKIVTMVLGYKTIGAGELQLPPAATCEGCLTVVRDAANTSDCVVGTGNAHAVCYSDGSTWGPLGGGGIAGNFTARGTYDPATEYAALDLVAYNGVAYVSVQDNNTGHTPDTSPTWWATAGLKGAPGDPGTPGTPGSNIELQTTATHVQWRVEGESTWNNLIALSELKGSDGAAGDDGREVQLQASATHIQWRYVGDVSWNNLVTLDSLRGTDGADGREIELQTTTTHIQWRYIGEVTWTDLVALSDLKGDDGGPGADGREVEFQKTATHIQWRYVGDSTWNNLVPLSDLKGDPGPSGIPNASDLLASGTQLTVTHDGGLTDPYALTFSCVDEDDGRKVEPSGVIATADDVTFSFASTETNVRCTVSLAGASLPPQLWKRSGGVLSPWWAGDSVAIGATLPEGAPSGPSLYVSDRAISPVDDLYLWPGPGVEPSVLSADANTFGPAGAKVSGDTMTYAELIALWDYFTGEGAQGGA